MLMEPGTLTRSLPSVTQYQAFPLVLKQAAIPKRVRLDEFLPSVFSRRRFMHTIITFFVEG